MKWVGEILFAMETGSWKIAIEAAIKSLADPYWANLYKEDLFKVLSLVPNEVDGLRKSLIEGKIDGSYYEGECACLVGTIANARKCDYKALSELKPDSNRPAERWFMRISPGFTPENSRVCKITLGWIDEWIKNNSAVYK